MVAEASARSQQGSSDGLARLRKRLPKWVPSGAVQLGFTALGLVISLAIRSYTDVGDALFLAIAVIMLVEFVALTYIAYHLRQDSHDAVNVQVALGQAAHDLDNRILSSSSELNSSIERVRNDLALALSVRFQRLSDLNDGKDAEDYLTKLVNSAKRQVFIVDLINEGEHVNDAHLRKELREAYYEALIRRASAIPDFEYTRICQFPRTDARFRDIRDTTFLEHCQKMLELQARRRKLTIKMTTSVVYPTTFGIVDGESLYLDLTPSPSASDAHLRGELIIEDKDKSIIGVFEEAFYFLKETVAAPVSANDLPQGFTK